jgi:hypothetical protein
MIAALLIVACGGGDGATSAAKSTATRAATADRTRDPSATREPSGPRIVVFGQTVSRDGAEFTVHGYRRSSDENGRKPPAGQEWLIFDLTVSNTSQAPFDIAAGLRDSDGRMLKQASDLGLADEIKQQVEPGESLRGEIAFAAQKDDTPDLLFGPGTYLWAIELGMFRSR